MPESPAASGAPGDVRDFVLPDLGEGLEDASIVEWRVARGDSVELNQVLCVVETEKASVEIPSPFAGTVVELGGEEGDRLRVGEMLVRIAVGAASREPTLVGYGFDPAFDRSRRDPSLPAPAATSPDAGPPEVGRVGARPLAPPPVRKLAHDLGVDLAMLAPGSGPGGVVTRADVEAAAGAATSLVAHSVAPAVAHSVVPAVVPAVAPAAPLTPPVASADTTVPVQGIRARIAERTATSRAHIPDATCSVVADCTRLREVHAALRAHTERRGGAHVTLFALLCRLLVEGLRAEPTLNASFVEDGPAIRRHGAIHLGVATATDRGLLVPVVRDAQERSVFELATEITRLADRAREGTSTPAELVGSTFTVSNFGVFGIDEAIPVINHPEAAILGVGAIKLRPHVVDGAVTARHTAHLTLVFDHRVADGSEAGRLLALIRELVEAPELALLAP